MTLDITALEARSKLQCSPPGSAGVFWELIQARDDRAALVARVRELELELASYEPLGLPRNLEGDLQRFFDETRIVPPDDSMPLTMFVIRSVAVEQWRRAEKAERACESLEVTGREYVGKIANLLERAEKAEATVREISRVVQGVMPDSTFEQWIRGNGETARADKADARVAKLERELALCAARIPAPPLIVAELLERWAFDDTTVKEHDAYMKAARLLRAGLGPPIAPRTEP